MASVTLLAKPGDGVKEIQSMHTTVSAQDASKVEPEVKMPTDKMNSMLPKFNDAYEARKYYKERLALAFRIFAKYGFDEGVAGHITLRVSYAQSSGDGHGMVMRA